MHWQNQSPVNYQICKLGVTNTVPFLPWRNLVLASSLQIRVSCNTEIIIIYIQRDRNIFSLDLVMAATTAVAEMCKSVLRTILYWHHHHIQSPRLKHRHTGSLLPILLTKYNFFSLYRRNHKDSRKLHCVYHHPTTWFFFIQDEAQEKFTARRRTARHLEI